MIMNGDYVDHKHLKSLLEEMCPHVTQKMLQSWRILSNFSLPKVFNFLIWKVHEDIPHRIIQKPRALPSLKPPQRQEEEQPIEDVQAVDDQDDMQPMERSKAIGLPFYYNDKPLQDFLNLQDPQFLWKRELDWKCCRTRDRCAAEMKSYVAGVSEETQMLQISHMKEVDTLRQSLLAQVQKLEAAQQRVAKLETHLSKKDHPNLRGLEGVRP
ncbi:hypothetical protein XENOCAPTIV_014394 [Xenoophorus captivus]|uniref:Uncharacterized protein n=1 Tax=Xenoophorus captivus TaxID=1517983 RepID=A0ABV0RYP9_9TELE